MGILCLKWCSLYWNVTLTMLDWDHIRLDIQCLWIQYVSNHLHPVWCFALFWRYISPIPRNEVTLRTKVKFIITKQQQDSCKHETCILQSNCYKIRRSTAKHTLLQTQHGYVITHTAKYGMNLLIHSKTSVVEPLKFGDVKVISSHIPWWM